MVKYYWNCSTYQYLKFSLLDVQLKHVCHSSALSVVQGYNEVISVIEKNSLAVQHITFFQIAVDEKNALSCVQNFMIKAWKNSLF